MRRLSNVADNHVLKNTVYDELAKKVNAIDAIDASELVRKTD